MKKPQRLLVIDIDGLRQDVFHLALEKGDIPNLARILQTPENQLDTACHLDPASTFPSITFCAQSTLFTGAAPARHGVLGNQFFDRFGQRTRGKPRFYAFDVGDALAYEDAVLTFTESSRLPSGLVGKALDPAVPTLYQIASKYKKKSAVIYHMVSRGADTWIRPDLVEIARFTKGGGLIGISAEQYDAGMLEQTLSYLDTGAKPDILTVYFMGLDHTSHLEGPGSQKDYLSRVVDPLVGKLLKKLEECNLLQQILVAVVSDHGQVDVIPDDRHSLRLSFPFEREMAHLFDALGLDVNDKPGEGPAGNAVVAANGGMAHVYLRNRGADWSVPAEFQANVLRVARAFWQAHATGEYSPDMKNFLAMVMVRDVQHQGWHAAYRALLPSGDLVPPGDFLDLHPEIQAVDGLQRINDLACPVSGDILLISNYREKYYFGKPLLGVHGGLSAGDSLAVASFGIPGASQEQWAAIHAAIKAFSPESGSGKQERANLADVVPLICSLMQWKM